MALVATATIALRAEPVDHLAVDRDRLRHPVHRLLGEPAAGVHALPEPRDGRAPLELDDLPSSTSATSSRVVLVPMSMTATRMRLAVQQLEYALDRPGQHRRGRREPRPAAA